MRQGWSTAPTAGRWLSHGPDPKGRSPGLRPSELRERRLFRGRRHATVKHMMAQFLRMACALLKNGKPPIAGLAPALRAALMVFMDATLVNPTFNSRSKETCKMPPSKCGSRCELPDEFVRQMVDKIKVAGRCRSGLTRRAADLDRWRQGVHAQDLAPGRRSADGHV